MNPPPPPLQVFDHLVKWLHEHHRLIGYHDMHRSTKMIRGTPFIIVSAWSVVLMAIQTLMHQYYGDEFTKHCMADHLLGPAGYVAMFSCVETVVLGWVNAAYIGELHLLFLLLIKQNVKNVLLCPFHPSRPS